MGAGWSDGLGAGWFDAMGAGWSDSGAGGGAGGRVFAMRADRPMVAENTDPVTPTGFPPHYWDSDLFALTFLPDFFNATVAGANWAATETAIATAIGNPPVVRPVGYTGPVGPNDDRIDELRILAVTERPEAMGEILNQHQDQQLCFLNLLMITKNSHPATYFVMKLAARVGEVVMMRLKRRFNRPRPSQYCPTLYPPLSVPGHASYPAGHAVIANLTAEVLKEVTTKKGAAASPYDKALTQLANEIGLNRVIAGFHFHSDIVAGAKAAKMTHDFLKGIPDPNPLPPPPYFTYATAVAKAQKEWS